MHDILTRTWAERYEKLIDARCHHGYITEKTKSDYTRMIRRVLNFWGDKTLSAITVADIADKIHHIAAHHPHSARRFRLNLCDFFQEAQRDGLIPLGYNPALVTREPFTPVTTNRLTLSEWSAIFCRAESVAPRYFVIAMLLALVAAQRRGDIVSFHSTHVFDGHLHIRQQKTGEMIALPLNLRLNALDITLADVIAMCPPSGLLLQQSNCKPVNTWSLSYWFKRCRDETIPRPKVGRPPSFREQRSLSERLYREEGIDTRTLLGHRHQSMTDQYNSLRGRDYRRLVL